MNDLRHPVAPGEGRLAHAGSDQPWMYALSGYCRVRCAEMRIVCAMRPASRSPSSSASAGSSGMTDV